MVQTSTTGFIYILHNPALRDDYLKIGMTEQTPEQRAKKLSASSGVPHEFVVAYRRPVVNPRQIEREIHQYLDRYRVNERPRVLSPAARKGDSCRSAHCR